MREPRVVEARRAGQRAAPRMGAGAVVLRGERAGDVAGADAQLQHHRGVARLGELEAFLDQRTMVGKSGRGSMSHIEDFIA